jgi:DUF2958 family protein
MLDLLPVTMRPEIPDLYSQEHKLDPMVYARFHTGNDEYEWFLTEFNQDDQDTCFGYIVSADGCELGYFSLTYLQYTGIPLEQFSLNGQILYQSEEVLPEVIRDDTFTPRLWSVCRQVIVDSE